MRNRWLPVIGKVPLALVGIALLAACQKAPSSAAPAGGASAATVPPAPPAVPAPVPGVARKVAVKNDLFEFDYAYPAAASRIPALKAWLDADLAKTRAELEKSAKEGKADAQAGDYPFNPYATGTDWKVVTDLPGWLSLSATVYDYSGGAHPNHGYAALLWDKGAGKRLAAADLFTGKAALSAAIRAPFCDAIDRERARRRGARINRASGDDFDACIDPVEQTVILGSAGHKGFDRIGVLVGPYAAGPYAEGDYEVTLPISPALLAAVKPQYRSAFAP